MASPDYRPKLSYYCKDCDSTVEFYLPSTARFPAEALGKNHSLTVKVPHTHESSKVPGELHSSLITYDETFNVIEVKDLKEKKTFDKTNDK